MTSRRRPPVRVALDIADRALRADIVDACDDTGIEIVTTDRSKGVTEEADVVLIDRPLATAIPAVAVVSDPPRGVWPANVCAVIPADADAETLAAAITVVAAGYALTARAVFARQDADQDDSHDTRQSGDRETRADGPGTWTEDVAETLAGSLSAREREVLTLLAEGASNKEIAIALTVSVSTVKFHLTAIMAKLGARSRVDAVTIAIRSGLVMV
jgi:DNA-binding NarL/FixJ family response regulator